MRKLLILIGAIIFGLAAAPLALAADSTTVTLSAENNSGETGTVTLTAMGDQTQVVIKLNNAPASAQPAHVHEGTCANLNPAPKYPLADVVNGTSTTTINAKLADLMNGNTAINVHKSASDLTTYVACGNITKAAAAMTPAAPPSTGGGYGATQRETGLGLVLALVAALGGAGLATRRRPAR